MLIVDWIKLGRLGKKPVPYEMIEDGELAADEPEVAWRWCSCDHKLAALATKPSINIFRCWMEPS